LLSFFSALARSLYQARQYCPNMCSECDYHSYRSVSFRDSHRGHVSPWARFSLMWDDDCQINGRWCPSRVCGATWRVVGLALGAINGVLVNPHRAAPVYPQSELTRYFGGDFNHFGSESGLVSRDFINALTGSTLFRAR
jgi:hypothetical protein